MLCFHLVRLCMCSNFFLNLLRVLVLGGHVHLRSEIKICYLCSFLLIWFVIDDKSSNSLRFEHSQAIHWILRPLLRPFWWDFCFILLLFAIVFGSPQPRHRQFTLMIPFELLEIFCAQFVFLNAWQQYLCDFYLTLLNFVLGITKVVLSCVI